MSRTLAALLVGFFAAAIPAAAADNSILIPEPAPAPAKLIRQIPETRPSALPAFYAGIVALQSYDAYSTLKGIRQGSAFESNPVIRGAAGNPIALVAVKAGVTASSIYAAERLWRDHHRTKAVLLMAVSNGLLAAVAANNHSVLQRAR